MSDLRLEIEDLKNQLKLALQTKESSYQDEKKQHVYLE